MASIIETSKIKSGKITDKMLMPETLATSSDMLIPTNILNTNLKKPVLSGYYIHNGKNMTQYLLIENIRGNIVKASVKTTFSNLSYSTEFYEGTISGDRINLYIINSDLLPVAGASIRLSEEFSGIIGENVISGNFSGEFSNSVVFKKC